jgi:hypothetical protein
MTNTVEVASDIAAAQRGSRNSDYVLVADLACPHF